ncbi:hypothetical protein HK096_011105, partial [Nowakowskiella sp. JEL0078]
VLQRFEVVISFVQHNCAQHVITISLHPTINKPEIARQILAVGRPLFPDLHIPQPQTIQCSPFKNLELNALMSVPKDLAFALDVSMSMEGVAITACRKAISEVISLHITEADCVRLDAFSDRMSTVFSWTKATATHKTSMTVSVEKPVCSGGSSLWDSLAVTISSMNMGSPRAQWVCVLTNGKDDMSLGSPNTVKERLCDYPSVALLVVLIGKEHQEQLKALCFASRGNGLFLGLDESGNLIEDTSKNSAKQFVMSEFAVQNFF